MTTIIYDHKNKQIAVDSRMSTASGTISDNNKDKTFINNKGLWFLSGQVSDHKDLVLLKHNEKCDVTPNCEAILLKCGKAYLVFVSDSYCSYEELTCNNSIGTGAKFAISALDFGNSAKEAVEYAITKDCYSGGKVRVFNLDGEEVD